MVKRQLVQNIMNNKDKAEVIAAYLSLIVPILFVVVLVLIITGVITL